MIINLQVQEKEQKVYVNMITNMQLKAVFCVLTPLLKAVAQEVGSICG
jgi:hypothetical protein